MAPLSNKYRASQVGKGETNVKSSIIIPLESRPQKVSECVTADRHLNASEPNKASESPKPTAKTTGIYTVSATSKAAA
jgi:hypothetical protein